MSASIPACLDLGREYDVLSVSTAILLEQHRVVRNIKAIQENLWHVPVTFRWFRRKAVGNFYN